MKKIILLLLILAFAFAACDDGGKEKDVKLLPSEITREENGKFTRGYKFKYDNQDRLEKLIVEFKNSDICEYLFYYDTGNALSKIEEVHKNGSKKEYQYDLTIQYDKNKEQVSIARDSYQVDMLFKVDKYQRVTDFNITDMGVHHEFKYFYDNNSNLITEESFSMREDENPSEGFFGTKTSEYSSYYSPYINLNLPSWLLVNIGSYRNLEEVIIELPFLDIAGKNMKIDQKVSGKYGDGRPIEAEPSDIVNYMVYSDRDNYPTRLSMIGYFYEMRYEYTYTIVYQKAK